MKINDTEYQLPENIELLILSLLPDQNYGPEWVNVSGQYKLKQFMGRVYTDRRSGRSTRIIDEAIQALFTKGEVVIRDHYDRTEVHQQLANRMKRRLDTEHGGRYKFDPKELKFTL